MSTQGRPLQRSATAKDTVGWQGSLTVARSHPAAVARLGAVGVFGGTRMPVSDVVAEQVDDVELQGDADGDSHDVGEFRGQFPRVEFTVLLPFESGPCPDVDLFGDLARFLGQVSNPFEGENDASR